MKIYTNEVIKAKLEKKAKINRILNYIFYPIIFFIVVCALTILYQKGVKKEENVNLFGYRPYVVLSGSMEPSLQVGDIVVSKCVKEKNIQKDDIITFIDGDGNTITHRVANIIIKDGKKYYQTKGDNNNSYDVNLITQENILGKFAFKIGKVGGIIKKIATPAGIIFVIFIISIGYINASRKSDRKVARHIIRERYKKEIENNKMGEI